MLPWVVTMLVWLAATPTRAEDVACIRLTDARQRYLLIQGLEKSPTFSRVAAAVCRTDAIVYVEVSQVMPARVAGTCQLVVSTPAGRFLRIHLNTRVLNGGEMIAVLAHELQHASEIGRAPWVREPTDVLALQRTLAPGRTHSPEADRIETQVLREVFGGARPRPLPGLRMADRATDELACGRAGDGPCNGSATDGSTPWRGLTASNNQERTRAVLR
jgi:hypothetical protein